MRVVELQLRSAKRFWWLTSSAQSPCRTEMLPQYCITRARREICVQGRTSAGVMKLPALSIYLSLNGYLGPLSTSWTNSNNGFSSSTSIGLRTWPSFPHAASFVTPVILSVLLRCSKLQPLMCFRR